MPSSSWLKLLPSPRNDEERRISSRILARYAESTGVDISQLLTRHANNMNFCGWFVSDLDGQTRRKETGTGGAVRIAQAGDRAYRRGRNRVQISAEVGLSYPAVCQIVKRFRGSEEKSVSILSPRKRGRREGEDRLLTPE